MSFCGYHDKVENYSQSNDLDLFLFWILKFWKFYIFNKNEQNDIEKYILPFYFEFDYFNLSFSDIS